MRPLRHHPTPNNKRAGGIPSGSQTQPVYPAQLHFPARKGYLGQATGHYPGPQPSYTAPIHPFACSFSACVSSSNSSTCFGASYIHCNNACTFLKFAFYSPKQAKKPVFNIV